MRLWISTDGNGGYDIGQGDATIGSVIGVRDIPRKALPEGYDPRTLALLFKAAPDLLALAEGAVSRWSADIDSDEEITGSEAVEWLCNFIEQARDAIAKAKGGAA